MKINWKKEILTIPNLLSLFRLLLIPVYVSIYLNATEGWHYIAAAMILAVSCLTDLADGYIARNYNMISTLGKILDPVADKFTQLALILCLCFRYTALRFLICLFLVKEIFQLVAGGVNLSKGKMLEGALMSGKVCTTVLFTSLIIIVMFPTIPENIVNILACIDIVFMLIAFGDYIMAYFGKVTKVKDLEPPIETQE